MACPTVPSTNLPPLLCLRIQDRPLVAVDRVPIEPTELPDALEPRFLAASSVAHVPRRRADRVAAHHLEALRPHVLEQAVPDASRDDDDVAALDDRL